MLLLALLEQHKTFTRTVAELYRETRNSQIQAMKEYTGWLFDLYAIQSMA